MEVHAHSHTADPGSHRGRKKWTHYFWEFMMLFLAVFCGFLAEYQLEHTIEHQRAKDYAASMITDLANDTLQLNDYRKYMAFAAGNVDTLFQLLSEKGPKEIITGKLYWYGLFGGTPRAFVPNDATMQQMKGSGSLRYFTNKAINRRVAQYDRLCRVMESEELNDLNIYTEVRKIRGQIFEYRYNEIANRAFSAYWRQSNHEPIDSLLSASPPLLTYDKSTFNQYVELVRSRFLSRKANRADSLFVHASELIVALKKEYHLE